MTTQVTTSADQWRTAIKATDDAKRALITAARKAKNDGVPVSELARQAGVARVTMHEWLTAA